MNKYAVSVLHFSQLPASFSPHQVSIWASKIIYLRMKMSISANAKRKEMD